MSNIIDELLESFRSSGQKLEELSEELVELQSAQKLVESLSSSLGDAVNSLNVNAISHNEFVKSAQATNNQLGEVINVLKDLDTKSINSSLSRIVKSLDSNKIKLSDIASALSDAEYKADAAQTKLDQLSGHVETLVAANGSLSKQLRDAQKAIIQRADAAAEVANGRHQSIIFLLLIAAASSGILVANLFKLLPI
jgi:exonuclease VII small subunit